MPSVLFIADHLGYPGGVVHGATTYYLDTLPALAAAGVRVVPCFLREYHPAAEELRARGVEPIFLSAARLNPFVVGRVAKIAQTHGCTLIHANNFKSTVVARLLARRLGLPWNGPDSLYDPETNIILGTAYLREKEEMYGKPYVAIAAYNAGPTPTARWLSQRPDMDPDIWIETISYRETREYVARVLAFSVIYDWRMYGMAVPVTDRMRGIKGSPRKRFACPASDPAPRAG